MATEEKQNIDQEKEAELPSDDELFTEDASKALSEDKSPAGDISKALSDSELFAGDVCEELSEREVFTGNENFYKLLTESSPSPKAEKPADKARISIADIVRPEGLSIRLGSFSNIEKVLIVSIVLIAGILLYALLKPPASIRLEYPPGPVAQDTSGSEAPMPGYVQRQLQQIPESELVLQPRQPLSLKIAENFYLSADYSSAYDAYNQLRQSLPNTSENDLLRDFLQFKMALCMKKAGDPDQANQLFRAILESRSPIMRVVANYNMSLVEVQKQQYLKARTRAYQAIALVGLVDFDKDWAMSVERNCYFLVAEAVTRKVLLLYDVDKDLPQDLWSSNSELDPFANLSEARLRVVLNYGSEHLSKGLLGPQILRFQYAGTVPRWSVICQRASIEELLARFAANAGLDISWDFGPNSSGVRERSVSMHMPSATVQQTIDTVAGSVGLLARWDDNNAVILDPVNYSSLSDHIDLLSSEAVLLWQNFLLMFQIDRSVPNAHFALGLLQALRGRTAEALAEYKFVANRYSQTSLAPFALLHSSKLKTNLRDYTGAQDDLKQLIGQYPDSEFTVQACLYLADATMKVRFYDEAERLYRKVYNLDVSSQSHMASAFGIGRCGYEKEEYDNAAKWLIRYINLSGNQTSDSISLAYFLLGKSYQALGKPEQACNAFEYALAGRLSKEQYAETVLALAEGQINQSHFIKALNTLENIQLWNFSQKESTEILLLKTKTLRTMGLVDKAIEGLGDRAEYIADSQLKARVLFELTKCYVAKGDLESARGNLTKTLIFVKPGTLAHEVICELADVCLKLGRYSQTISICSQLLDLAPSQQIRRRTLNIMTATYKQQKNYDKAVSSFIEQADPIKTSGEKLTLDTPDITDRTLAAVR